MDSSGNTYTSTVNITTYPDTTDWFEIRIAPSESGSRWDDLNHEFVTWEKASAEDLAAFEKSLENNMNTQTGIQALLQSRRFITAMVDVVITLLTYFVGKYYSVASADLLIVIGVLQVPIGYVIGSLTLDDMHAVSTQAQLQMHTNSLNNQMDIARLQATK